MAGSLSSTAPLPKLSGECIHVLYTIIHVHTLPISMSLYMYTSPSYIGDGAGSRSVVDGEGKLKAGERSCKMVGVEGVKRGGRGRGRVRGVMRVDERRPGVGRGRGKGRGDPRPIVYQQPCLPTRLGEY